MKKEEYILFLRKSSKAIQTYQQNSVSTYDMITAIGPALSP